jgi:hypothetical protein
MSWVAEHHHHRARSFIGPPSSPLDQAWHVSVISRSPPAACRLIFPNTRLIITRPPPALGTSPVCSLSLSSPALHYYRPPYYSTCPFCPHRRQLVPTPNPLLALPQSTTPGQRSGFTTTASKPAHHLRPDSFRLPDHRPLLLSQPPHRIHRTDLLHRSPATAGPRVPLLPSSISDTLAAACPSLVSFQCCLLHFPFPISALPSLACDLVVVSYPPQFTLPSPHIKHLQSETGCLLRLHFPPQLLGPRLSALIILQQCRPCIPPLTTPPCCHHSSAQ